MNEKERVIKELHTLIKKIQNNNFSEETVERLSQDIFPYVHSFPPPLLENQDEVITYLFRGWAMTRLLEENNQKIEK